MITSELISYIKKQIQNNISKDLIVSKLLGAGWRIEDIEEGLSSVQKEFKPEVSIPFVKKEIYNSSPISSSPEVKEKIVDNYREPLVGDNIFEIKKQQQKAEAPVVVEAPKIEPVKTEAPRVWTPMSMPIKAPAEVVKTTEVEIRNPELQTKKEEFVPTLMPKTVVDSFGSVNKNIPIKQEIPSIESAPVTPITPITPVNPSAPIPEEPSRNYLIKDLPKIAMLSSYQNDVISFKNKPREEMIVRKPLNKRSYKKVIKWLIIIISIIILGSLIAWVFASGYINISKLNFIKKDPKVLLLENSKVLSSLKSYKTETNVEISSPSFSNISYGLLSGQAVTSTDKDNISINTLGIINKSGKDLLSDNFITIKGSVLPNYITTDIKNDGSDLFVSVPDLSGIIKENSPEPSVVKINEQQFSLIPPLFSPDIEAQLNKINIYKILSSGIPSYVNNDTLNAYDELVNSVQVTEKGQDNIKGVDTYHYSITTDRQLAKNLLTKVSNNLFSNLSDDDNTRLTEILGSLTIDSFDVWVGKGDNNIYQYSAVLDIPLSKIVGFDDKSIGDNKVTISWTTTYYDFNISNNIFMPDQSITVDDFVKNLKESRMKTSINSFKQLATNLFNAEKGYGVKSNANGSCMNPTGGSLFSPLGHTKKSATPVSALSSFLNDILGTTNGAGFCYSTPQAWSFTIPISDNYDPFSPTAGEYKSYYCIDSTGVTQDLTTPPTSVVCK